MDQFDDTHRRELHAYAQRYLDRGWKLVKLHHRGKQAVEKGWQNLERTPEELRFGDNLGVRFGPQSGGLVDVDLDYATARALVSRPAFGFDHLVEFDRTSLPQGARARLVIVPDAPNCSRLFTIRTKAGTALARELGLDGNESAMIRAAEAGDTAEAQMAALRQQAEEREARKASRPPDPEPEAAPEPEASVKDRVHAALRGLDDAVAVADMRSWSKHERAALIVRVTGRAGQREADGRTGE